MSAAGRLNKSEKSSDQATEAAKSMLGNFDELGGETLVPLPVNLKTADTWVDDNSSDADNKKKTEYSVLSANSSQAIISFKGTAFTKAKYPNGEVHIAFPSCVV